MALTLAMGVSTASALRSIQASGELTVRASGNVTIQLGGASVWCDTTITRTISRAIPKISGTLLGKIARIAIGRVREGRCEASFGELRAITILGIEREEVGRLFFLSFTGTLPRITAVKKRITGLRIEFDTPFTGRCLYIEDGRGVEVTENLDAAGVLTTAEIGANVARLLGGGAFCPRGWELNGTLRATTRTTLRLV